MQEKLPKRNEVPKELTWRLEDIYETPKLWEADFAELEKLGAKVESYQGKIENSAEDLLNCLKLQEEGMALLSKLYRYAGFHFHQDTSDPENQVMYQKAGMKIALYEQKLAFISPAVISISDEKMEQFYKEQPELSHFDSPIREIRRAKDHTLNAEMEHLMSTADEVLGVSKNTFEMLSNAELKFPDVKDSKGNDIPLTGGRFVPIQQSKDRELRKNAFEVFYSRYQDFKNTWANLFDGEIKGRTFNTKARNFNSNFEAACFGSDIDPGVCDRLIDAVHKGMEPMYRYVRLRKKLLGVDELHMYDVYVSMIKDFDMEVDFEKAKELTLGALEPMGEEYLNTVKEAYANRWIDVLENEGKMGGAYSASVIGVHPYMLLNYHNTLDDVFTLIHEMGHTMHTWYSTKNQPPLDSGYETFVAEVASTTNEVLLYYYMKERAQSKEEKAYLVNHFLESFKASLFRQTMFIEFERKANEMAEEGIPVTADALCEVYYNLNKLYFGDDMIVDELISYEWCRIPHFYDKFYVYSYATSQAAAVDIAGRILKEGAPAVEQYKKFLSSGRTKDPVSLLQMAGVDFTTAKPIEAALKVFDEAIAEMEELFKD